MITRVTYIGALALVLGMSPAATAQAQEATPRLHILEAVQHEDSTETSLVGVSGYEDFGASPYGKGHLLFLSSRGTTGLSQKDATNRQNFYKPYLLKLKDRSITLAPWASQQPYNYGVCALMPDSSGVVVSRNRTKPGKDGTVGFTLEFVSFSGEAPKVLPFVNPNYSYQHPYFHEGSYTLYFSSNVPGGEGGYDIYASSFGFDGTWSKPVLVEGASSRHNDVFPTVSADGEKLFLSRPTGRKGLDLYSVSLMDTVNAMARVLPGELNSRYDDFSLVLLSDSTLVYTQAKRNAYDTDLHFVERPRPPYIDSTLLAAATTPEDSSTAAEGAIDGTTEASTNGVNTQAMAGTAEAGAETNTPPPPPPNKEAGKENGPAANATYSLIIGGFNSLENAETHLERVLGWAPNAYLATYNNKFYVVENGYATRKAAEKAKQKARNRGIATAWILSKKLPVFTP